MGSPPRAVTVSPFLQDLALTVVTSVATIAALILFARVLAGRLDPEGFGAIMVARRIVATADPVSTFAMAVALTRFASLAAGEQRARVLVAGAALALGAGLVCGLIVYAAAGPLARASFGDVAYAPLMRATALVIPAYSAFIALYAWYRGAGQMARANAWQLWAIAVGPVAVAWLVAAPGGESRVMAWLAAVLATALVPLAWELVRALRVRSPLDLDTLRALRAYAAPRVPGGLAFGALLAIGPLLAPHVASLAAAGYVATGQALLRVVEGATEGFGRAALAKVTQLFAAGEHALLRERVADLGAVVLHVGLFATAHLWLWAPELIDVWLGPEYAAGVPVVRVVVLGVLPYLAFVTFRSVLDAVEERAVNTWNLYAAVTVTLVLSLALGRGLGATGLAAGMTMGMVVLGVLTFAAVHQRYRFSWRQVMLREVVAVNAVLLAIAAAVRAVAGGTAPMAAVAAATEALLVCAYGASLWYLRARWMQEIRRRVQIGPA